MPAVEVARFYQGLIDALVVDRADATLAERISELKIQPLVTNTVMTDPPDRVELARHVIHLARTLGARSKTGAPA